MHDDAEPFHRPCCRYIEERRERVAIDVFNVSDDDGGGVESLEALNGGIANLATCSLLERGELTAPRLFSNTSRRTPRPGLG